MLVLTGTGCVNERTKYLADVCRQNRDCAQGASCVDGACVFPAREGGRTEASFTRLIVPGACKLVGDLGRIRVSAMMQVDEQEALLPIDTLRGQSQPLGEQLSAQDFEFWSSPISIATDQDAFVERVGDSPPVGVDLRVDDLTFHWSGGEHRKHKERLVLFLLDSSSSLIGENPQTSSLTLEHASDLADERFTFFRELLKLLPEDDWVSLVWFNGHFPTIDMDELTGDAFSRPTRDRDLTAEGLMRVSFLEEGSTPLAAALSDTLSALIDAHSDLNPVVILFTDGVEEGDVSSGVSLQEVTRSYETHAPPIPVIVLQLQPHADTGYPQGRDRELVDLACRTGGEHIFLEQASDFSNRAHLQMMVRNRVAGAWWLNVETTLDSPEFGPGAYFLSSELALTLDGKTRSASMVRARDDRYGGFSDTRLWFHK